MVLANTAVTAGTYGSASAVPVVTVDPQGRVTSASNVSITPVITGAIFMWPTSSAPSGYLVADGSAVSRTTYASLFAVIGTTFGAGDGSGTFNLPNYTNRMPIGAGTTAGLAVTGGSADAIVVNHTHTATSTVTDPGHFHSYTQPSPGTYVQNINGTGQGAVLGNTGPKTTGITVATTLTNTGSSATNANLPPYLGIYFIIKT